MGNSDRMEGGAKGIGKESASKAGISENQHKILITRGFGFECTN